jgi:putative radical SAM enzyme (TIGR03279 family)
MHSQRKKQIIKSIVEGSIAEEMEIEPGDELVSINGKEVIDIFDFEFLCANENLTVVVRKQDGEEWELEIEKDPSEELGLIFEDGIMDNYSSCRNKCIFCFIDQNPPGMRETIYFKDDDTRLSFLSGSYVTLTNMKDEDIDRLISYNLSPINVSVHTTNPELRCKMLHNRFAGTVMDHMTKLYQAGIDMNGQVVLCKGWNDGVELDRTINDLSMYIGHMKSLSVVPVGITKFRNRLTPLEPFNKEESIAVVRQIEKYQKKFMAAFGTRFVYASDEWYLKAELPIPEAESYEEYPQIGNGVGMVRLLNYEVDECLEELAGDDRCHTVSLATGTLAYPILCDQVKKINEKFPNIKVNVYEVINNFFGDTITVAGLLTGQDIIAQLTGRELGEKLLLPCVLLKTGEDVLLDDMTVGDIEKSLQIRVSIVKSEGSSLVEEIINV